MSPPARPLPARNIGDVGHRCAAMRLPGSPHMVVSRWCGRQEFLSAVRCACDPRHTTHQHNTHITDVREICYSWHPWHGRAVRVHASLVKRGQAVAHCSLEDVQACRVLEIPLWMLDVAACCKTRASKPRFAGAQSLRDLKEVLQAARPQVPVPITPKTQPRYLLHAGGADGGIDGPAEIEPTPVVCSSAMQSALDESVVRCSTKDRAIAGAVTETASSHSGRSRNRRGGPR